MTLSEYIDSQASKGRYSFTIEEAMNTTDSSYTATLAALRRLIRKGFVASPYRGFYVIVPPEYRHIGCLPPEQFVPDLMKRLGIKYYAGLLSAAEFYGASHQRPQVFQVVSNKNRPAINCGKVSIKFIARKNVEKMPTIERNTPRGHIIISSPETTTFDLVGYSGHCGALSNIVTIFSELNEQLRAEEIEKIAPLSPVSWSQRLGYLFEISGNMKLTESLSDYVKTHAKDYTLFSLSSKSQETTRSSRWKLIINEFVEPDL